MAIYQYQGSRRNVNLKRWVPWLLVAAAPPTATGGLPVTETELRAAYAGKRVVVCGSSYGIGADIAYGLASGSTWSSRREALRSLARGCRLP